MELLPRAYRACRLYIEATVTCARSSRGESAVARLRMFSGLFRWMLEDFYQRVLRTALNYSRLAAASVGAVYRAVRLTLAQVREPRLAILFTQAWLPLWWRLHRVVFRLNGRGCRFYVPVGTERVKTTYGDFHVRPHSMDLYICSPVYEQEDRDYLLGLIDRLVEEEKEVLFLDVGSSFGLYAVTVGRRFKESGLVDVMAFEPAGSSYRLLRQNVLDNGLSGTVQTFNLALTEQDGGREVFYHDPYWADGGFRPSSPYAKATHHVDLVMLDSLIMDRILEYDAVVFKIDVEGMEKEVLSGAEGVIRSGVDVYIMAEDIFPGTREYLEGIGARFVCKLTDDNGWWRVTGGYSATRTVAD